MILREKSSSVLRSHVNDLFLCVPMHPKNKMYSKLTKSTSECFTFNHP